MSAPIFTPARRPRLVRFAIVPSLALLLGVFASTAPGQITVDSLIGSAVSDMGPQYNDVQEAIDRFMRGDVLGAHQFLVNATEKFPQLPPPDVTLAKMQAAAGNAGAARGLLERAAKESPDDPEAYLMIADIAFPEGRLTEAGVLYEKATDLVQKMTGNEKRKRGFAIRTHAGRAAVAERRGDFEQAKGHLTAWVEADPESATAHHRLATTLFRLAKNKDEQAAAYEEFNRARQLDAKLPHPDVTVAKLFHQMKDPAQARQFFERAVQNDGKNWETLFANAQWLMEIGEAPAALQPLRSARLLKPEDWQLLLFSGVASKMAGNMDEAEQFLLDALKFNPASQDVLNQLALVLASTEDDAKKLRGLQFARVSAALFPQNAESAVTLGFALYKNGQLQEADRTIQNALRIGQLNMDSSYLIARILFENNKPAEAGRILDSVIEQQGIFVHRDEAQQLRAQIGRTSTTAPVPTPATPAIPGE
jgi:tetratricopeptide (TPR) repeat protein